uniref:Uncharacterized protein n=1 Tax=Oryza nivara TaxID=4536 RepID=A0A0E0GPZ6_ORYNI
MLSFAFAFCKRWTRSGQYNVIVRIAAHSFGENQNKYLEERIIGCDAQLLYTSLAINSHTVTCHGCILLVILSKRS